MGSVISLWLGTFWQDSDDCDGHDSCDGVDSTKGHDGIDDDGTNVHDHTDTTDGQDEPDVFYECSSAGYLDVSDVTRLEDGDTYFEDLLDPRLQSLDLVVDNLYHHLQGPDAPTGVSQGAGAVPLIYKYNS